MTRAVPILKCRDIACAERFYLEALGATRNWRWDGGPPEGNPGYRSVTLMGAELHLSSFAGDGAFGTAVYLYVEEVDGLAARLHAAAPDALDYGPADQPWRQREVHIRDPDNNLLRFGAAISP